jgi:uncharacterized protein (TIGR01777 family)
MSAKIICADASAADPALTSLEIPRHSAKDLLMSPGSMQTPKVMLLGVTGFIGSRLPRLFSDLGFEVTGVSRASVGGIDGVTSWQTLESLDLSGHHAIVNLAGERIDQRWTHQRRQRFHDSRVGVTQRLVSAIAALPVESRPAVLVNASAVGVYGDRGDELLNEQSAAGHGYLADLCREWEQAAMAANALGVRVVCMRIGIVLGRDGSAFRKLLRVFRCGIGGRLGNGRQWMPWIHVDDLRSAMVHAVQSSSLSGPVNGTAPAPVRNADFTRCFARAVHRPALMPVPGFALKLVLGGFGGALLVGQRAVPSALEADGFHFRFPTLESALADLLRGA